MTRVAWLLQDTWATQAAPPPTGAAPASAQQWDAFSHSAPMLDIGGSGGNGMLNDFGGSGNPFGLPTPTANAALLNPFGGPPAIVDAGASVAGVCVGGWGHTHTDPFLGLGHSPVAAHAGGTMVAQGAQQGVGVGGQMGSGSDMWGGGQCENIGGGVSGVGSINGMHGVHSHLGMGMPGMQGNVDMGMRQGVQHNMMHHQQMMMHHQQQQQQMHGLNAMQGGMGMGQGMGQYATMDQQQIMLQQQQHWQQNQGIMQPMMMGGMGGTGTLSMFADSTGGAGFGGMGASIGGGMRGIGGMGGGVGGLESANVVVEKEKEPDKPDLFAGFGDLSKFKKPNAATSIDNPFNF